MAPVNQSVPLSISVGRELAEVAEQLRRCTVEVRGAGRGSGVIWRSDGLIVTNAHVANSSRHAVQLADGRVFEAELIRREPGCDLAALHVDAATLSAAQCRNASSLRTGEIVLAVGNPLEATGAFTVGIVSAAPNADDVVVRADIRLSPGNSGGPLADAHGRVVGINSMVVHGFGVAVTTTAIERFLAAEGQKRIGVTVRPIAQRMDGSIVPGLLVVELESGGAAHLSGVLIGDVIIGVNGRSLNAPAQLARAIQAAAHALSLEVLREGRRRHCEVMLTRESVAEAV